MELASDRVTITGNTATGLFYGVQTLVQLLKPENGKLLLPEAQIEDWPDLELRVIYWDDAHHLEHLNVLKAALRQASFYKINGFSIKLEGHFQYQHAQPIVEPYALTPAELQELTDYGLKYHVQLIPYLDGPAHDAFILKIPSTRSCASIQTTTTSSARQIRKRISYSKACFRICSRRIEAENTLFYRQTSRIMWG